MATPLSEVISYLSFEGDILQGEEFETIKVLLQEFGSISVVINPSANVSLSIQFSNDGINFDSSNNYSISSSGQTITSVILGKWARLKVINTVKQTVSVRMSTFAQVIPIAIQSQLESEGDIYPSVNVDNLTGSLFGDLRTVQRETIQYYSFQYYSSSAGFILGPDRDLSQRAYNGANFTDSPGVVDRGTISLSNIYNAPLLGSTAIQGDDVSIISGNSIYCNFACGFSQDGYTNVDSDGVPNDGFDTMLVGLGYINESTGNPLDGIYVGYPSNISGQPIVNEFCFVLYADGNETVIPKSEWIFDSLDGQGSSRITLDPTKISTWRVRTAISCSVYLEYHNPFDNLWVPCHRIQVENLVTNILISNPSLAFSIFTKRTTNSSGDPLAVNGCGPFCSRSAIGFESGVDNEVKLQTYSVFNQVPLAANTPTEVLSIRNGPFFNSILNRSNVRIDDIYVTKDRGGSPARIQIVKGGVFVAPVWTDVDPLRDCVQVASPGTLTIGTGYTIRGIQVSPNSTQNSNFNTVDNELSRLETLSVVATSATATTILAVTINYSLLI